MKGILTSVLLAHFAFAATTAQAQTVVEYIHTDALGSVVAITDTNQRFIQTNQYEPYGQVTNEAADDGPGYTGHLADSATGLVYMQQRYYDPIIGRFLSVDPISAYTVGAKGFNRYWYAAGNPYRFMDPDGRYVCSGGKADCDMFDKAMDKAKSAAVNPLLTPNQRETLQNSVTFYGEKGKEGVSVAFGSVKTGYAMTKTNDKGTGTITFDLAKIGAKNPDGETVHGVAMRALHEGDHGDRIVKLGHPSTRDERLDRERYGYWAEAYYQKATHFLQNSGNMWAPWNPGDGFDRKTIEARATHSVESSCSGYVGGNC